MKKLLIIAILLLTSVGLCAQEKPWLFRSVDEIYGKRIYITWMNFDDQDRLDNQALVSINGKYKKFSKIKDLNYLTSQKTYQVTQPMEIKGKQYVCLGNEQISLYLPTTYLAEILTNHILSVTWLDSEIHRFRQDYAYLDNDRIRYKRYAIDKLCPQVFNPNTWILGKYCPVNWISYTPNHVDSTFIIKAKAGKDTVTLTYPDFQEVIKSDCLVSKSLVDSAVYQYELAEAAKRRYQEEQDSIRNNRVQYCIVKKNHSIDILEGEKVEVKEGDTIPLVQYLKYDDCFHGIYNFQQVKLNKYLFSSYYTIDIQDQDYLKRNATMMDENRYERARVDDSLRCMRKLENTLQELKRLHEEVDSIQKEYNRRQIFMLSQDYAYGDYHQFGLSFKLYNCFNKTIKYVELKVVSYNQVDDVQRDDIGRTEQRVRCIGPIEPTGYGTFTFDELFWDENDIIKYLQVNYIKLTFMDNTTKVFSGWANIKKHYL